ncbi:MAG: exostosin family protein [Clostridia bacterium]|nr:exostosin family protein [Clostridia bacterium]
MQNNAWYLLKPHQDFTVQSISCSPIPRLCDFASQDINGLIRINSIIFNKYNNNKYFEVNDQNNAEFILFPFEAKDYIETGNGDIFINMIRSINKYPKVNQKLIICDSADNTEILNLDFLMSKICYFKVSLLKQYKDMAYPFSYNISNHILNDIHNLNDFRIRYDVSFVGNLTNPIRKFICLSVQRENSLCSRISFDSRVRFEEKNDVVYVKSTARNHFEDEKRQAIFRKTTQQSLCVLCPPGFGPQSIRFYETLFYGRIPILFDVDVVYPFEDFIDYQSFALIIPKEDICRTGAIITEFIRRTSKEELYKRCAASRKTFFTWFSPEIRLKRFCEVYLR